MTGQPTPEPDRKQLHRRCVFDLRLDCGHTTTVAVDGWYPVSVACCNRLGGTILHGRYLPYASHVDYVQVLSERYEHQPKGTPGHRCGCSIADRAPTSRTSPAIAGPSPPPDATPPGSAQPGASTAPVPRK
jgi:hypothetical protein